MNQPCLKLTAYFGERQPAVPVAGAPANRFLADEMLNLFGAHEVATSVMLRGIASFGPSGVLRTDESLSLSENPPVTVAAVDVETKISGLIDDVVAMTPRGLVTLERAHLVGGSQRPDAAPIVDSPTGDVTKLTVYVGRQDRVAGVPPHRAVCDLMSRHGFAGATVLLGVDGTAHGHRQRARFFSRNVDVPLMIIGIGTAAQVSATVAELGAVLPDALPTVERVRLCKRAGELLAHPQALPPQDERGRTLWQKLMVHTAEDTAATGYHSLPIHRGLVRRLLQSRTARGATVLRGVWGFDGDHKPHGDRLFQIGRRVPVVTIIVDTPEAIAASFDIVDELTARHGLVTSEMVPAAVTIHEQQQSGDIRLARYDY